MNKVFIVVTNSDYMILCVAQNEKEAIKKSQRYYKQENGEGRNDWEAYEAIEYLNNRDGIMPIRTWIS